MNNLPIPQSRSEELMNAFIQRDSSQISTPQSRIEEFWYHLIEGTNSLPIPQSRNELLLKKIIENDTHQIPLAQSRTEEFLVSILTGDINKLPIPQSRSEYYLDYIARNNLLLNDIDYVRYSGTNITATNTVQKPFRSAILSGNTGYHDIDTGEFLERFEEGRNLELVSVRMPVLATSNQRFTILPYEIFENSIASNYQGFTKIDFQLTLTDVMCYIKLNNDMKIKMLIDGFEEVNNRSGISKGVEYSKKLNTVSYIAFYNWNDVSNGKGKSRILEMLKNGDLEIVFTKEGEKIYPYYSNNTKTNILTVNEEVTLRGIGDIKDTLNLSTGELHLKLGSKNLSDEDIQWIMYPSWETDAFMTFGFDTTLGAGLLCNNFIKGDNGTVMGTERAKRSFYAHGTGWFVTINKNELSEVSVQGFKEWLNTNPTFIIYKLPKESVKTVDLKVVNQDGNQVKELSAFDGTTYIVSGSASDNSLIAITEVEVPTKLIEVLDGVKSLSSDVEILINEVDNTQKLQDENSTMAMSAMTELYEMILMMGGND